MFSVSCAFGDFVEDVCYQVSYDLLCLVYAIKCYPNFLPLALGFVPSIFLDIVSFGFCSFSDQLNINIERIMLGEPHPMM